MSVNSRIIKALKPFGYPVNLDFYNGKEERYFSFNYADDRATSYADNEPVEAKAWVQIHLFLPAKENYLTLKKQVRKALFRADFSYPSVEMDVEDEIEPVRHLIFECETHNNEELEA